MKDKLKVLSIIIVCFILFLLLPTNYQLPIVSAQTSSCGSGTTRATALVSTPSITSGSKFNTSGACIIDIKTTFAPFKIPSYDDLKSIYYDQSKSTKVELANGYTDPISPNTIYHRGSDVEVNSFRPLTGSGTAVIFVGGNFYIKSDINYGSPTSGVVFVVRGDVNIDKAVTIVTAILISSGTICTAFDGTSCPSSNITASQLIINGSLISLDAGKPIKFRRALTDNSQPAEKIVYRPKYLVILRNLFADTLQKWSEVTQ